MGLIPWEIVGPLRDQFEAELNESLAAEGSGQTEVYLEVTCLQKVGEGDTEQDYKEYLITGGVMGERIVPDCIPLDETDSEPDAEFATSAAKIEEFYGRLVEALVEYPALAVGVRALVHSPNPGTCCDALVCEPRPNMGMWLRRYYCKRGKCCKKWIRPC